MLTRIAPTTLSASKNFLFAICCSNGSWKRCTRRQRQTYGLWQKLGELPRSLLLTLRYKSRATIFAQPSAPPLFSLHISYATKAADWSTIRLSCLSYPSRITFVCMRQKYNPLDGIEVSLLFELIFIAAYLGTGSETRSAKYLAA